jgi:hypothetical protein
VVNDPLHHVLGIGPAGASLRFQLRTVARRLESFFEQLTINVGAKKNV